MKNLEVVKILSADDTLKALKVGAKISLSNRSISKVEPVDENSIVIEVTTTDPDGEWWSRYLCTLKEITNVFKNKSN